MNDNGAKNRNSCLVGHTGFVGSALLRQTTFSNCFSSRTISDICGRDFSTVVCAAAPGSMFEANRSPAKDLTQIEDLMERLSTIRATRFVLISSIAVLAEFAACYDETTNAFQRDLAYGRHRRKLETFVEDHFPDSLVVRLPALFGRGLRKNFVFDVLNPVPSMLTQEKFENLVGLLDPSLAACVETLYSPDSSARMLKLDRQALDSDGRRGALEQAVTALGYSATQFHNPETTYQYYDIARLWADIGIALEAGLSHIHLVSEPLETAVIHKRLTGRDMPDTGARLHREDMHTRHAALWGATGPYQYDAAATLDRLADFYARETAPA